MSQVYHDLIQYLYHCVGLFNKTVDLLYPPHNEVVGGYIGFTPSIRLSVRPSVRPSVPHAVSAL